MELCLILNVPVRASGEVGGKNDLLGLALGFASGLPIPRGDMTEEFVDPAGDSMAFIPVAMPPEAGGEDMPPREPLSLGEQNSSSTAIRYKIYQYEKQHNANT